MWRFYINCEHYEKWIGTYSAGRHLIVDVSDLDYVRNPEDLGTIIDKINNTRFGLF